MKILNFLLVALFLFCIEVVNAQTARVQIIHNAPNPTVDIYTGTTKLLDDFSFRTATPFIDVPAGVVIPIGVALSNSTASTESIATFPVTFTAGKTYVVVATGIVGGTPGFTLKTFDMGIETTTDPNNVGICFFHGSPDAPTVDIVTGGAPIIDNASYGDFQGYLQVPAASYDLKVTPGNDNNTVVAAYTANLAFWKGKTAVIFASGFLTGGTPAFEPWVALSNGGTFPLAGVAPPPPATARVQIIHNAPTPTVDIYTGTTKLLDNFVFRNATPFIDVPAGVVIPIGVALGTSTSSADAIATFPVTFAAGKTYVVVATGIVGGTPGFTLKTFDMGIETTTDPNNVGICFFHGSPDAPTVDIVTGGAPIIDNASYGDFQGYLQVPAAGYDLKVTPGNDNNATVASYRAELGFWKGKTAVIFASGFLGNNNPRFEPWVALSNGGTFPLTTIIPPPIPTVSMARVQIIHNAPTPTVDIYAGTSLLLNDFAFRTATPYIDVPAGVPINIGVALSTSTSSADAIATFPVTFEMGKRYVVVATGIVGGTPGFTLKVTDTGSEFAELSSHVGILFFHGSPDAPTIDITTGGSVLFNNVSYGEFKGYAVVPAAPTYTLKVTPGDDNNTTVAAYKADLSFWAGRTAVVFASGFLSGTNPSFEPWVALDNGATFPLPAVPFLRPEGSEDRLFQASAFEGTRVYPNPAADQVRIATNLLNDSEVNISIYNQLGKLVKTQALGLQLAGEQAIDLEVGNLPNGSYSLMIQADKSVETKKLQIIK
jgi:Secretion system C-terminal sorting domain/Domain of unknown function (DUF4397)